MGDYAATILKLGDAQGEAQEQATGMPAPVADQPVALAPAPPKGGYGDTIRALDGARADGAKAALLGAADANPDEAAKAQTVGRALGMPASIVEGNTGAFQQQLDAQKAQAVVDGNPVLASWLAANPQAARIAKDDFDRLDMVSKAWQALSSGWSRAYLDNQRGRLGTLAETGADVSAQVDPIDKAIARTPELGGVYGALQKVSGFAGGLLDNFMHAAPDAAAGMAAGAGIGAAATPEALGVGAAPGALAGLSIGASVGINWDMARIAAGNAFLDMGKIKGVNGEAIDPEARQAGAVLVGLGTYALASMGGALFKGAAKEAAATFMKDAVGQALQQPTMARALTQFGGRLAKAGLEGATINAGLEGINIFGQEAAKTLSGGQFETVLNDPVQRQQALDNVMAAALDGAMLFPVAHLPFAGVSLAGDLIRARQAGDDHAMLSAIEQGAAASKLKGRSLEAFRDFLAMQGGGEAQGQFFIPGHAVRELYQGLGVEPGEDDPLFGKFVPDIADQLGQAEATGGDVVVPAADYIAHFAGTPVSERLRPDLRVRQDAMTAREAQAFLDGRNDVLAGNAVDMHRQLADELAAGEPERQVYTDMFSKLRQAGYTNDTARQYASLVAARYATRALRLEGKGGSALDLYNAEGVDVRRVLPPSVAALPVDETDMVLNALRKGSKMPSDRELFGPSLMEYIAERGGIIDTGGELKAMDLDKVPLKGLKIPAADKKLMKGLIRRRVNEPGENELTPDAIARDAWERGFFPEAVDRPTPDDLFEALREEAAGTHRRYQNGTADERRAAFKAAVDDMDQFLTEQGLDINELPNDAVKRHLADYHAGEAAGREFGQAAYHGSPFQFDKFTLDHIGKGEGAQAFGWGLYFASNKKVAEYYRDMLSGEPDIDDFTVGDVRLYRRGAAADYSPKTSSDADIARALFMERLLGEEHAIRAVFADGGEEAVRQRVADTLRDLIRTHGPEGLEDDQVPGYLPTFEKLLQAAQDGRVRFKLAKPQGRLYQVELAPTDDELLDWDKPLNEQPQAVRDKLSAMGLTSYVDGLQADYFKAIDDAAKSPKDAAAAKELAGKMIRQQTEERTNNPAATRNFARLQKLAPGVDHDAIHDIADWYQSKSGADLYAELERKHEATAPGEGAKAASLELLAGGIKGIKYLDAGSRDQGEGHHNFVIFDHADVAIRGYEQESRGKITLEQGRAIIHLFHGADLSTFLHESGHLWLDELVRDASGADAPQGLKDDLAAVLKWMGAERAADIGTEQHELFARGFERYLMEGRAPSTALAAAFSKFKAWLVQLYRNVVNLRSPISDELRQVFDRMVASDEEIDRARRLEGLNPIFPDAESAGMTAAEFKAYTDGIARARAQADERVLRKTMEAIRAERTAEWRAQEATVRGEVHREVVSRPDLKALHFLRTGRMLDDPDAEPAVKRLRLSRAALQDMYGNDEAAALLPRGSYSNTGGVHPDELADLFGYRSGDELVRALMTVEAQRKAAVERTGRGLDGAAYVAHLVDEETQRKMLERHGDALNDGSIEEEALRAVHSRAQADVMATELRVLARKNGSVPPLTVDDMRRWVDGEVSGMPVARGANPAPFRRAEAKASRETERALLKGDHAAAFQAKQRQLLNHLLAQAADLARDDYEAGKKLFQRYASKPAFSGIDQGFTDRIHELLKRFGYDTKRSDRELAGGLDGETLEGFVSRKTGDGYEIVMPSIFYDPRFSRPVDQLSVDEFRALKDAITSLAHVGRAAKLVEIEGKRVELEAIVGEAVDQIGELKERRPPPEINPGTAPGIRGMMERLSSLVRRADAALMKQENIFDWLDGGNPLGVFNRVVFRRLKEAQHRENDLLAAVTGRIHALKAMMPKGWDKRLNERMTFPELRDHRSGSPYVFRRKDVLALALNTGNDGNFDKLTRGYKWSRGAVQAVLDRVLTKQDWDFVQGVWDTFETLYPDIEKMTRRLTGVGPEKVDAMPVKTRFGDYRGGYYPVVYDPLKDHRAELHGQKTAAEMFENNYFRATTPKGHTLKRIDDYAAPIRLSLDVIPWKLGQAVHDLAFREAIMDADKFLTDKRVREGVDRTLGHEYTVQFRRWLQSIANDRNIDEKGLAGLDWLARQARINTTIVGIGFRASTMLKHGTTALFNSMGELGGKYLARGAADVFKSPQQFRRSWEFMVERSGELRHRMNQIDRDVREGLRALEGETGLRAAAERYGHYGVAILDMASALPTWMGAYRKALDEGQADGDAVYIADKAVRNAHGGQGVTDLAQIQRGGEIAKLFTMFYGFFNHIYNRQRDTMHQAALGVEKAKAGDYAGARRDFALVLARTFFYLVVPAVVEAMVSEGAPDPDKGEGWLDWAAKAIGGELPAGIPLLRDVAKAAISGRSYEMSPVAHAVEAVLQEGKDVGAALGLRGDKEVSSRWVKHAVETPGYVFGLPTGQASGSVQYLWDIFDGDEQPDGLADFMRGVLYGPKPKSAQ